MMTGRIDLVTLTCICFMVIVMAWSLIAVWM
jgi:hypothetical protein